MVQRVHEESGTHTDLKLHMHKRNLFYKSLLDKYELNFFKFTSDESDYKTLSNLGDICMKNGLDIAGRFYFRKAFQNKPKSLKVLLFSLFGLKLWKLIYKI